MIRFFLDICQHCFRWRIRVSCIRFPSLHGRHGHLNVAIVAVDLFLKVFLAFFEMAQSFCHILDLLLALQAHAMFAANIMGNGIQDALIPVTPCNLALFL